MVRNVSSSKMHLQLSLYFIILQWTDGQQIWFLQMFQTSFLSIETPAISINSQNYEFILNCGKISSFNFTSELFVQYMESSLRQFQWMLSALHYSSICELLHLITPLSRHLYSLLFYWPLLTAIHSQLVKCWFISLICRLPAKWTLKGIITIIIFTSPGFCASYWYFLLIYWKIMTHYFEFLNTDIFGTKPPLIWYQHPTSTKKVVLKKRPNQMFYFYVYQDER